jgi:hypothetical protein
MLMEKLQKACFVGEKAQGMALSHVMPWISLPKVAGVYLGLL